jgi:hypothetical protein
MDVWKELQPLIRNKRLGFGPAFVFAAVYEMLDGAPGEISVTTQQLRKVLNRDRSTILGHIKKLNQFHELFDVKCRYSNGTFDLRVYRPCPAHAAAKPDSQKMLPGLTEVAIIGLEATCVEPAAAIVQGSGLGSQESKRSDVIGESKRLAEIGTASQQGRGENPTETADPWGKPHALAVCEAEPWGKPHGISREGRGENPTAKSPRNAEQETRGENPTADSREGRGENPTAQNSAGTLYPRAPASLVPMKEIFISPNGSKDTNDSTNPGVLGGPAAVGKTPRSDGEETLVAALQRQLDQNRQQAAGRESTSAAMSETVVEAVKGRFSPAAQKSRLVREMRGLVNDPNTKDWLFGYAADVMLVHGQGSRPDAGEIFTRMQRVLVELREFRELRQRMGQTQMPRGQVFNARVMAIVKSYGIPTPRELKLRRQKETVR